jgi:uncharacterized phage protein (TIGR02218 family)
MVICRTEVDQNGEASSGNIAVTLDLENPVAQLLAAGPNQVVNLTVFCGHDGESEVGCAFTGRVSTPKFSETCEITCESRQATWKQQIPSLVFQNQCPLRWGGPRCGVTKDNYRVPAAIEAINGLVLSSPAFAAHADGWFRGGWVELNGVLRMITGHTGSDITLLVPMPGISLGAQVVAFPGCPGTEEACRVKFSNLDQHLGCCRIPGINPFGTDGIA